MFCYFRFRRYSPILFGICVYDVFCQSIHIPSFLKAYMHIRALSIMIALRKRGFLIFTRARGTESID